jgi:hypothetical protein
LKNIINYINKIRIMKKIIQLSMLAIVATIFSCNHSVEPQPAIANGTLKMHIHTNVDTSEVTAYNTVYRTNEGRRISVDSAQLYLSNFQLVKLDGSTYDIPGAIVLQVQNEELYLIGDVPAGNYKSIRFHVGLDPTSNLKIPSNSSSDVLNKPGMWFGSNAQPDGYVFVNFKGSIDTTVVPNSSAVLQPFSYKIGTNANYTQVSMPDENYSIAPGQTQIIHILTDYNKLFTNVPLNPGNRMILSPIDNSKPIMTQIKVNIPSMFDYEM